MTLENWVRRKAPDKSDFIVQMDIEGAEYEVICDTSHETFRKFRILAIEFHEVHKLYQKDFLGSQT
jgi:FkbM family methyltransferase